MNKKRRVIAVGAVAVGIALVIGARHCLRAFRGHGSVGGRRPSDACRPAACMERRDHDQDQKAPAVAA